jgi:hypothetical protein
MDEEEIRADERRKIANRLRRSGANHNDIADAFGSLGADGEKRLHRARADIAYEMAAIVERNEPDAA